MNCFCEDCNRNTSSYEDWIVHLVGPEHQEISASVKIKQWSKNSQNQTCVLMASLFEKKDPLEIAQKFSKFGFLWNFYIHEEKKFFIFQYDTKQTAEFSLSKVKNDTSWKLHVRLLKDLTPEDWFALFPPKPPKLKSPPPPRVVAATETNGVVWETRPSTRTEPPAAKIARLEPEPASGSSNSTSTSATAKTAGSISSSSESSMESDPWLRRLNQHRAAAAAAASTGPIEQPKKIEPPPLISLDDEIAQLDIDYRATIAGSQPFPAPNNQFDYEPQGVPPPIFNNTVTLTSTTLMPAPVPPLDRRNDPVVIRNEPVVLQHLMFDLSFPQPVPPPLINLASPPTNADVDMRNSGGFQPPEPLPQRPQTRQRSSNSTLIYPKIEPKVVPSPQSNNISATIPPPSAHPHVTSFVEDLVGPTATEAMHKKQATQKEAPTANRKPPNTKEAPTAASASTGPKPGKTAAATTNSVKPKLLPLPPVKFVSMKVIMNKKRECSIDEQIDEFFKSAVLSLVEMEKLEESVVKPLEKMLAHFNSNNCQLYLMDSFQGGIASTNNALEINVLGLELIKQIVEPSSDQLDAKCEKFVSQLEEFLENENSKLEPADRLVHNIKAKLRGQISSVDFTYLISKQKCQKFFLTPCVTAEQFTRKNLSKLISFYVKLDPAVRSLMCLVYYWAIYHQFIQRHFQQIKDYVLSWLVIMFLCRKCVVPTLAIIQIYCKKHVDTSQSNWLESLINNDEVMGKVIEDVRGKFSGKQIFILDLAQEFFEVYGKDELYSQVICSWTADFLPKHLFSTISISASSTSASASTSSKSSSRSSSSTALATASLPPQLEQYVAYIKKFPSLSLSTDSALCVQNPFELGSNIGASMNMKIFKKLQAGCRQTAKLIAALSSADTGVEFMSIFTQIQKEEPEVKIPGDKPSSYACEDLLKKIQTKVAGLGIRVISNNPPAPAVRHGSSTSAAAATHVSDCSKYCYIFGIESRFRETFKTAMIKQGLPTKGFLIPKLCALWSNFAFEFIKSLWSQCYFMQGSENEVYKEDLEEKWTKGAETATAQEINFPTGHAVYYSIINCRGYFPVDSMKQCDASRGTRAGATFGKNGPGSSGPTTTSTTMKPHAAPAKNPFDEESLKTTRALKVQRTNRNEGPRVFNCIVIYEDNFHQPKLGFIIRGQPGDSEAFEYMTAGILRMFFDYQNYKLEYWLKSLPEQRYPQKSIIVR